ncbi:hypothetical protein SDJN03_25637, partial [Cucurbita argyrosperma subsp. sororia]
MKWILKRIPSSSSTPASDSAAVPILFLYDDFSFRHGPFPPSLPLLLIPSEGIASYYEGVFEAKGKSMSVCIGSNTYTDPDPLLLLPWSWNVTNRTVSASSIWNLDPSKLFETEVKNDKLEQLEATLLYTLLMIMLFLQAGGSLSPVKTWPIDPWWKTFSCCAPCSKNSCKRWLVVVIITLTCLLIMAINLAGVKRSLKNSQPDWIGDPCFNHQYRWAGITCSEGS